MGIIVVSVLENSVNQSKYVGEYSVTNRTDGQSNQIKSKFYRSSAALEECTWL